MNMKTTAILLSAIILVAFYGPADACVIVDKRKAHIGLQKGVSGRCSNNGDPITCVVDSNERWQCDGPIGTLHGYNLENVVIEACGCSLEKESEIRENTELMKD